MGSKTPTPKTETDVIAFTLSEAGYSRCDEDLSPLPTNGEGPVRDPLPVYKRLMEKPVVATSSVGRTKQNIADAYTCEKVVVGPIWLTFYTMLHKGQMENVKSIKRANLNGIKQYMREKK